MSASKHDPKHSNPTASAMATASDVQFASESEVPAALPRNPTSGIGRAPGCKRARRG